MSNTPHHSKQLTDALALLQHSGEGWLVFRPDGALLYANTTAREMMGHPLLEALVEKAIAVKDKDPISLHIHGVEFRIRLEAVLWNNIQAFAICISRNGSATAEKNTLLQQVVSGLPVFTLLFCNQKLVHVSPALQHWLQERELFLIGMGWNDIFHHELLLHESDQGASGIISAIQDAPLPSPMRMIRRDFTSGTDTYAVVVLHEEHAVADNALSPHRLMEIASHDLREPLRTGNSYLQLLTEGLKKDGDAKLKEYAATISSELTKAETFLTDMKVVMGLESRVIAPVKTNMVNVVREAIQQLKPRIDATDAMVNISEMPELMADSAEMKKVMVCLIENAIKFHQKDKRPYVEVLWAKEGSKHVFCVRDNGMGIAEKYHDEIFEPFKRLNRLDKYPGSGIGLTLSKKIIELHRGKIWIESREGFGTSVFFSLPAKSE
ncbi:MAG: ATP-binding protein [Chitinophagales bacterium]